MLKIGLFSSGDHLTDPLHILTFRRAKQPTEILLAMLADIVFAALEEAADHVEVLG